MRTLFTTALALLATIARAEDPSIAVDLTLLRTIPYRSASPEKETPKPPSDLALKIDAEGSVLTWTGPGDRKNSFELDILADHSGPRLDMTHLSWMVARSKDDFWILWAYFNDAGRFAWINYYHFADNCTWMSLFTGSYTYRPPAKFTNAPFDIDIPLEKCPKYAGKAFKHPDFGPEGGKFAKLRWLDGQEWKDREEELTVRPLVDLDVPGNNGWADDPWTEVHCLARSADGTRLYYVVTYTAVNHGWVVDLRDGRVLKTHFGEKVTLENK